MQRLRGSLYLQDGAITTSQLTDGRHDLDIDYDSWHMLVLDADDRVCGCARYREYENDTRFSRLSVARSALARCQRWGASVASAVEAEIRLARRLHLPYVELGGWALAESIRATTEALRMALATYALARALGGGIGLSTVTQRNGSASILKRLGGRLLEEDGAEIPPYYDPEYKCEMEILRFYSWAPNPRYEIWINQIKDELRSIPVLTNGLAKPIFQMAAAAS